MKEIWKDIKDFPDYEVSSLGRIRSKERITTGIRDGKVHERHYPGKILKFGLNKNGYEICCLHKDKKAHMRKVNRVVAEAFIDNPENKPEIHHRNMIKTDNRVSNLKWVTRLENMRENDGSVGKKISEAKKGKTWKWRKKNGK